MPDVFIAPSFGQTLSTTIGDVFDAISGQDDNSRAQLMDLWERARQGDNAAMQQLMQAFGGAQGGGGGGLFQRSQGLASGIQGLISGLGALGGGGGGG